MFDLPEFAPQDAFHILLLFGMVAAMDAYFGASVGAQALASIVYIIGRETEDYVHNRNLKDCLRDAFWLAAGAAAGILLAGIV